MCMITIDAEKCKKEGLCVELCTQVFKQEEKDVLPEVAYPEACFF